MTYNYLIKRIGRLSDERYEMGREALLHEMSALQSQINPHFLYNMLDLINLTALDQGAPEVAELVRMLATLLPARAQPGHGHRFNPG